ncbi:MAG: hemopexin repeat-containing protein, partial [Cyanobacteria bacterium P01_G01_bin.38]
MAINRDLPSYEAQFGVAFKQGEAARSVHSPAAYLADLLQLLDDYFASPDLDSRRSDLRKVPLDADHTFSLVPYLDIVNELLEARVLSEDIDETRQSVKQQAYEILKSAKYPFNLPFDLAEEEVKTYLKTFDVSRESLYKAFSLQADPTMIARLYLGLSPAMAKVLTTDLEMIGSAPTETALAELNACYNNVNFIELEQVSVFLKTTGISGLELRELLYQRLSTQELGLAKQFFINQGLAGYAKLSDLEDQLKWVGSDLEEGPIPIQWFSRVNRILRLSQQTGLSLSDLDLILRSCCDNHLDETAFQYIAIIKQIADNYDLAIDVVCSFFSNMNAIGQGDGDAPVDLFNRIFNENFIELDGQYFQASDFLPNSYQALGEANKLPLTGDLFSVSNADTQKRLLKALHLSADDLRLLVTTLQQKLSGVSLPQDLLSTLSLYYRVSTLAQTLDITLQDLFNLFDLLQQDPATRQSANFNPLIHFSIEALNCYEIIVGGRIKESMWLIQMLFALVTWMQKAQFSSAELNRIKTGTYQNPMEQLAAEKKTIAGLNTLYQQLKPFLFDATHFISEQVDERTARVLYKSLVADPRGLVSSQNYRLLKAHPGKAEQAMYQALNQLQKVYPQDFVGLGIQEKLQDKIFVNLILNGYLQTDGTLIEEKWPKRADDLMISHQFENEAVFDLIHGIYQSLSEAHPSDEGLDTFSVFLTDLNELYLCANHKTSHKASRKQELYDNLIYNGYLDAEGTVLDVSFFAESENRHTFESTVSINDYGHKIYTVIQAKIAAFDRAECQLDEILFSTLPLKEIEVVDLIENLKFNDYIDENNIVLNKAQLLELKVDQFNLVLRFYPHRHQILAIIQQHLQTLKAQHYILTKEDFSQISDEIVADDIYADLKDSYLDGDNFTEDSLEFFAEAENLDNFGLGQYFDDSARAIVFKAIRRMVSVSQTYLLTADDFADLAFTDDELFELFEQMVEQAYIEADGSLTPSQTTYFLNVNNALDFQLKGFEDFHKDIFFIGHALAKVRDERIQMLVSDYMTLAQQQEDTLLAVLQDLFEIPADVVDVICRHVFEADGDLVEQFVVPILAALDTNERILKKPDNCRFNIAFNRIQQFAWLVAKLDLNAVETDIIFRDQSLVEKFSEKLTLPEGLGQFDGLVCLTVDSTHFPDIEIATIDPPPSLEAIFLYQAQGEPMEQRYWLYSADDYQLLTKAETDLSKISPLLTARSLDAAFNDASGNVWMMSGADFFYQKKGDLNWEKIEKELGKVKSNFGPSNQIDAAFVDHDDKIYVFSGDQYLRSSGELENIDDGYPKKIQGNWAQEHGLPLPTAYHESIDAAILSPNDNLYFFKDKQFISSADFNREIDISQVWGQVNNNFAESPKLDAALSLNHQVYFFAGDQCLTWAYSLENEQGLADEGSIQSLSTLIPDLPDVFQEGVDAVFRGFDDSIHIFKDRNSLQCSLDFVVEDESTALNEIWGKVENAIASTGIISAAFSGLDGKVYLFSGTQYFRYSGSNYAYVDEGYPKTIADHWGGLNTVDVAFILDGKTYLLGRDLEDNTVYVRYSTNDYSQQDVDYPKPARDNWWVDHFNLDIGLGSPDGAADFTTPDTVFMGQDSVTYLLKDGYYIAYDKLHRWWSEPQRIADKWAGLTFEAIDAAFTGKDGRTYLFSSRDQVYARYTDPHFNRLDDRYPKAVDSFWGQVRNNIEETNKIDAAAVMEFEETLTVNGQDRKLTHRHTYLFSGNQFFRYTGETYDYVDEGYPKAIATSLKDEPRFKTLGIMLETGFETLDIDLATGLDAVFADRRNVYLFKGERCIVLSDTDYRQYDTPDQQTLNAVVQEDGVLYVQRQGADGWSVLKDLEGDPAIVPAVAPPLIKAAPAPFKDDIDTAFVGTDQTTYIFKDNQCYNSALEKAYPIHEEWGRVRNNITVDNRIDAAFVGADGKTYLFSGNQYVTYTSSEENSHVLPPFVDEHPNAIQADFGGLTNVNLAFIKAGKTYLLEAPDSTGQFRYICYSSDDYSQPDGVPQVADISWWEFPSIYVEEGFDRVDAVLIDDEHMFLFKGNQFIQYNQTEDLWTYPRPVDLIWRGLPFNDETGQEIVTVFKGIDTVTYFFSDGHVTHDASPDRPFTSPEEIRLRWGQTRNTILQNNRVDAAVVVDNQITYLFSGDQYVRYSTPDYRFIDDGYPKTIVKNLRQEDGFTHLPDSFDDRLKALQQASGGLSGLIAHERNIYIFETQHYHVVSRHLSGQFDIHRLGGLKNQLQTRNQVDAAFVNTDNQQTFLFSGDQYVRYSGTNYGAVDDGYPKSIASLFTTEGLGTAAEGFAAAAVDLDAAVWISSGKLYLFKSDTVYTAVSTNAGGQNDRLTLARLIPSQENRFNEGVDTAFVGPDGNTYFFKDDQYLRYGDLANEFVDGGFPRAIKDHWGNLPAAFEASIDHAFTFEGKTYFVKGDEYVRYSDDGYQRVDPIYPQKFVFRWGDWSDYFLSDIHVIAEFKAALEHNLSQDYTLSDLLNLEVGYKKEPYKMLSDIFGWAIEDVKWLKRKNAFYKDETEVEVNYNLELILKMQDIFHLSDKLFTTPQSLYEVIYKNDFDPGGQTTQVAQTLYRWLGLKHSPQDWQRLSKELHDQLNLIKQAVLLPYAIANDPDVEDSRSLFAKLLIDVNIGSEVMTSRIKEAIAAIQLYLHRYFVNLESIDLKDNASRDQLKQWWQWMRNYRIWEANRKAFLYPENYIRPELRNTKTPAFKELEDALLQGDMTQDLAATAFNDYLTEFSQVGNLKITGANVYDN